MMEFLKRIFATSESTTANSSSPASGAGEAPAGTTISEVLVPILGPPYETPLDLRCPLHGTSNSTISTQTVSFEEDSPEWEAQEAAIDEMFNNDIYPHKVRLYVSTASGMSHYQELSPPFFKVLIDEEVDWKEIHGYTLKMIDRLFGTLEAFEYGRLPVRYIIREKYFEEVGDPWWDPQ